MRMIIGSLMAISVFGVAHAADDVLVVRTISASFCENLRSGIDGMHQNYLDELVNYTNQKSELSPAQVQEGDEYFAKRKASLADVQVKFDALCASHRPATLGVKVSLQSTKPDGYDRDQSKLVANQLAKNETLCRSHPDWDEYQAETCISDLAQQSLKRGEFGSDINIAVVPPQRDR